MAENLLGYILSVLHISCFVLQVSSMKPCLSVVHQWNELKFVFPNAKAKAIALKRKYYVPQPLYNVPLDVDVYYYFNRQHQICSKIFITIPRFDDGRPITLGTLDENGLVQAYPDYTWHDNQGCNCDGMTSVFRTAIDKCNRLWVLDAGKIGDTAVCQPQLLAFDLTNDKLVFRHKFSNASIRSESSLFITPVLDVRDEKCKDVFVYIADVAGFALVIVDVKRGKSWHVTHRLFYPYPSAGTIVIDGAQFDLMDGIFGMALSPIVKGDRNLYFHALASVTENVVAASTLRKSCPNCPNLDPGVVKMISDDRMNQSAAEAMDSKGILYFGLMSPPSIWCWNSHTEYNLDNLHLVAYNVHTLQFASGVKVIVNKHGHEELWVLTSSFQRVATGKMNADEINFRIHKGSIPIIMKSNPCNK